MHTAKQIGLSLDEFWEMNPAVYFQLCGLFAEKQGNNNPFSYAYIDD